jgi:Fe-S-cluster containining protein
VAMRLLGRKRIQKIKESTGDPDVRTACDMAERFRRSQRVSKRKPRLRTPFECKQCGRCCLKYGNCLSATQNDIDRWEEEGRYDILELAWSGDLWVDRMHKEAFRCPWLRKLPGKDKYICRIHDTKPDECAEYPVSKAQALYDGCRGLGGNGQQ